MAGLKLVCIAVVCIVLASAAVDATITCSQVVGNLIPCLSYARTGTGPVPVGCCRGINTLNNAARTTPDRQATCKCLKAAASGFRGLKFGVIEGIPGKCRISIPYKLSPSTDCNSVK